MMRMFRRKAIFSTKTRKSNFGPFTLLCVLDIDLVTLITKKIKALQALEAWAS